MEADLRQYYNVDIRDLFDKKSKVTARLICDLIYQLPDTSRFAKLTTDDAFDINQHLLASIVDVLSQVAFQASISAAAQAGKEYKKISKKAPKPMDRPSVKPKKVVRKFAKTADLIELINQVNSEGRQRATER